MTKNQLFIIYLSKLCKAQKLDNYDMLLYNNSQFYRIWRMICIS